MRYHKNNLRQTEKTSCISNLVMILLAWSKTDKGCDFIYGQQSFTDGSSKLQIDKPIRLIELFAGIGAQAKALENLGIPFEHYRICEFDKFAVQSYNAIHGTNFEVSDITKINSDDLGICNTDKFTYIMTYSFPCTDLSKAGKQLGMEKGSGTRSGLLWEVERILSEMEELPQILLMENVPDVVGTKNISHFAKWIEFLDGLGYTSKHEILNATGFGVPQNRERCFMLSWLGDFYYDFPRPTELNIRLKDVLETEVDEKYYLNDAQVESLVNSSYGCAKNSLIDYSSRERERERAADSTNTLCERLQGAEVCKTIRTSGRSSFDRHCWDIVIEDGEYGMYSETSKDFCRKGLKDLSRTLKASKHDACVMEVKNG